MYSNEAVLVGRFKWEFKQSQWLSTLRTMCCSIPPRTTERMDMWQGDSALLWGYVRLLTFPRLLGCWNRCVFFQGTPYKSLYKILRTLLISHLPFPRKKCFKQDKDSPCAQVLRFAWNVMIFLLVSFPRETSPEGNLLTKTRGEMLTTVCSSCLQCILEFEWPLCGQSRRRNLWLVLLWEQSPS